MSLFNRTKLMHLIKGAVTSSRKIFIIEFDLTHLSSHFFNQALGFKRAAQELGIIPFVLVGKDVASELADPLEAHRVVEFSSSHPLQWNYQLDCFSERHQSLQSLWSYIEGSGITRADLILITSAQPTAIYSLAVWLSSLKRESQPAVFIRSFDHDYLDLETMNYAEQSWMLRFAARDLSLRLGQERVFFMVNNKNLVLPLGSLCSRRIFEMPLPKYYGESIGKSFDGDIVGKPTIYTHLNMRSGIIAAHVEGIIHNVLDTYPTAKFLVKYCLNALAPGKNASLPSTLVERGVELIPSEQSHADYMTTIARSDIVFLAYEATEYKALASGVFAEGAALGKVIVYPDNTWMADQINEGNAVGVSYSASSQIDPRAALLQALGSLSQLMQLAGARSRTFREKHCCRRNLELMIMLASQQHDMSAGYAPGTVVKFGNATASRLYLGRGWSYTEAQGVWTDTSIAELVLRIESPCDAPLHAGLLITPFLTDTHSPTITVTAEGYQLCNWDFHGEGESFPTWRQIMIPRHIAAKGEIKMLMHIDRPLSPREFGISADARLLGVMLHELVLNPA